MSLYIKKRVQIAYCGTAPLQKSVFILETRHQPFIDQAKSLGVTIVACGFCLKKFSVDPAEVPAGIEIVDNGIQYDFYPSETGILLHQSMRLLSRNAVMYYMLPLLAFGGLYLTDLHKPLISQL